MKELFFVDKIDKKLNVLLRNLDDDEEGSSIAVSLPMTRIKLKLSYVILLRKGLEVFMLKRR